MGISVNDKSVDTLAELVVAESLDRGGVGFPLFLVAGGECFGPHDFPPHDVGDRRHLPRQRLVLVSAGRPEFTHRLVGACRVGGLVTEWQVIAFDGYPHALRVGEISQPANVVLRQQLRESLGIIPAKSRNDIRGAHTDRAHLPK